MFFLFIALIALGVAFASCFAYFAISVVFPMVAFDCLNLVCEITSYVCFQCFLWFGGTAVEIICFMLF